MASSGSEVDYTTDDEEYEYEDEEGDEEGDEEEDSEDYDDSDSEYDEDDDEESEEEDSVDDEAEEDEDECENGAEGSGFSPDVPPATDKQQQKPEEISQAPFCGESVSNVSMPDLVSDGACEVSKDVASTADSLVVGEGDCEAPDPDAETKHESLPLQLTPALSSDLNSVKDVDAPRCSGPPSYIQLAENSDSKDTDLK